MRRRSRAGGEPAKARRHKTVTPKRRSAPEFVGQETVLARRTRERDEALERETATSVVLRLISQSPGDLELVFRSILENATRICAAKFGTLYRFDGRMFHLAAQFGNASQTCRIPEAAWAVSTAARRPPRSRHADQASELYRRPHRWSCS